MIPLELMMLSVNNFILYPINFVNFYFILNVTSFPLYLTASSNYLAFLPIFLSILSGIIVGFSLGIVGGGGSILAVPLLVYVIGLDMHVAIGTSALAVAANALINLSYRIGKKCIKIKEGLLFAVPSALGTTIGAELGLLTPSKNLLVFFALFMIVISILMLKGTREKKENEKKIDKKNARVLAKNLQESKSQGIDRVFKYNKNNNNYNTDKLIYSFLENMKIYRIIIEKEIYRSQNLLLYLLSKVNAHGVIGHGILFKGFLVGIAAGYFGIGGGFLIVPALIHAIPGLGIFEAIGTSLIPISAFGFLTATKYAFVGHINWFVASLFIIGGALGGFLGTRLTYKIPKKTLSKIFAIMLIMVAIYIIQDFIKLLYQ